MSHGEKPDFSDVSKTVRRLLGRDVEETKAARQPGPQGTIGVANGPIFFIGGVPPEALPTVIEGLNGHKKG